VYVHVCGVMCLLVQLMEVFKVWGLLQDEQITK